MTHTDTDPSTYSHSLLGILVRASVAAPLAELLETNAAKITRRVPDLQVEVTIGPPIEGGWCYAHRHTLLPKDGQLPDYCSYRTAHNPCLTRPTPLVYLEASATGLPLIDGDLWVVGVLVTDAEGVSTATSFEQGLEVAPHLELAGQCHHCHTTRDRRYTLLVRDGKTGPVTPVGQSCARELTGGALRDSLIRLMVQLREALQQTATGGGPRDGNTAPLLEVLALTIAVTRTQGGYVRSGAGTRDRPSTRDTVYQTLVWDGKGPRPAVLPYDLTGADLDRAQIAIDELATWEEDSDFAVNLRRIAASECIEIDGRRQRLGMAVCIPDAAARAALRRTEREQREAQQTAEAAAAEPAPLGRGQVTGTVLSRKLQQGDFRDTWKMLVKDDRGFKVWASIPSEIAAVTVGSRVQFVATLQLGNRDPDPLFAIGLRPIKAQVLLEAPEEPE